MTPEQRLDFIIKVTPQYTNPRPCPACNGEKLVEHIGEYETLYEGNKRLCPLCLGSGVFADAYTIMQREAIAIIWFELPEEGMLYPTITPMHLKNLRLIKDRS